MKNKKCKLLIISIVIIFILLISGCNNPDIDKEEDIHEINISAIEHVLKKSLTCPSLNNLDDINPSTEGISIIGNGDNKVSEKQEKNPISEELKSIYEPYFTENYYEKFIGTHAMTFEAAARRAGYKIRVDNINVTTKENDAIGYDFKVNVTYWKDSKEKSTAELSGTAQCLEEGKISYINYFDDGGLLKNIF